MRPLPTVVLALVMASCGGTIRGSENANESAVPVREGPDQVRVRRLLVGFEGAEGSRETRTAEEAEERATMLSGLARDSSQSFRELVSQYGDRPPDEDDRNRIRLLVRGDTDLTEANERAVFRLRIGEVTRPLQTPQGFVLYHRESDPEEEPEGPSEIGARHILIGHTESERTLPGVTRTREEARQLATRIAHDAQAEGADWVALHAEYSDEPPGRPGGDLGVFGRGRMVRAFEDAAFGLDINEIMGPVESPFGFHIIQRTR